MMMQKDLKRLTFWGMMMVHYKVSIRWVKLLEEVRNIFWNFKFFWGPSQNHLWKKEIPLKFECIVNVDETFVVHGWISFKNHKKKLDPIFLNSLISNYMRSKKCHPWWTEQMFPILRTFIFPSFFLLGVLNSFTSPLVRTLNHLFPIILDYIIPHPTK